MKFKPNTTVERVFDKLAMVPPLFNESDGAAVKSSAAPNLSKVMYSTQ